MYDEKDYNHFVAIVAGENPEELMKPYDSTVEVEPYVVFKHSDAETMKTRCLAMYEKLLNNPDLSDDERTEIREEYITTMDESADELFYSMSEGCDYDEETGDAISRKNPNGKWKHHKIGNFFSVPFLLKTGEETYVARKNEIDWPKMHLSGQEIYRRAWEMVMEGSEPENETEQFVYENMKNRTAYFMKFETKENYVVTSTAFWGYAFLSKDTGWQELEVNVNQFDWVSKYYERFIKPLPEDTLLTIYECVK